MTTKAIILLAICAVVCASKAVGIKKLRLHREEDVPINWQEVNGEETVSDLVSLNCGMYVIFVYTKSNDSSKLRAGLLGLANANLDTGYWSVNAESKRKLVNDLTKDTSVAAPFVAIYHGCKRKYISSAATTEEVSKNIKLFNGK